MGSNNNILVKLKKAGYQLNNKFLVEGVSLEVQKGKIVAMVGGQSNKDLNRSLDSQRQLGGVCERQSKLAWGVVLDPETLTP